MKKPLDGLEALSKSRRKQVMKLNTITLNLRGNLITLATHMVDGKELYKAQDLLVGHGMAVEECENTLRNWSKVMNRKLCQNGKVWEVTKKTGKNGGTYLTKREILKLAGYVDYDFEDAVYEAFELLTEGKTEEAQKVASLVVDAHEHMLMCKPGQRIGKLLRADSRSVDEFVKAYLDAMGYNSKAKYEDRVRTALSLGLVVEKYYDTLHAREQHLAAACERSLRYIVEYVAEQDRLHSTLEVKALREALEADYFVNIGKYRLFN